MNRLPTPEEAMLLRQLQDRHTCLSITDAFRLARMEDDSDVVRCGIHGDWTMAGVCRCIRPPANSSGREAEGQLV